MGKPPISDCEIEKKKFYEEVVAPNLPANDPPI